MIELKRASNIRVARSPRKINSDVPIIVILAAFALFFVARAGINAYFAQWTTAKVESIVSQNLHRDVKLGHVRWSLGIDGLIFRTDSMDVKEPDGKPFLKAENTELSFAVAPLLQHQVRIMHVDMLRPVFWAKKLRPDWWNCSDLSDHPAIRNINHLGVTDGTIILRDNVNPANNATIKSISCQVTRPFGDLFWNFAIGFVVPHPAYQTKLTLNGVGHGSLSTLAGDNYKLSVNATQLNPSDFLAISSQLRFLQGPIDLKFDGSGVPAAGMSGKVSLVTPRERFSARSIKYAVAKRQGTQNPIETPPASDLAACEEVSIDLYGANIGFKNAKLMPRNFSGQVIIDHKQKIYLHNIRGLLGGSAFTANGDLQPGSKLNLTGSGNVLDLQAMKQSLQSIGIPTPMIIDRPFYGTVKTASVKLTGEWNRPEIFIRAQPQLVFYQPFGKDRTFQANAGEIEITRRSVTLHKLSGKVGRGTFQLDGVVGTTGSAPMDATFSGKNVDIATVKMALAGLGVDTKVFNPAVSGSVEGAVGSLRGSAAKPIVSLAVVPRSIFYQPLGTQRTIELIGGRLDIIANALHFVRTRGRLDHGDFELNGLTTLSSDPLLHVRFKGRELDLSIVKTALLELGVKSPLLAEQLLYGIVKNVSLAVDGKAHDPKIDMVCHPRDVLYEPIGSSRAVHMLGGTVLYNNDVLTVQDMTIRSPRSRLKLISMIIDHLSKNSSMRNFVADAQSFDLTDLHSYLAAPRTPPELRKQYLTLLHVLQMEPHSGKTHGQLNWHGHDGTFDLAMDVVFDHASANTFGIEVSNVSGRLKTEGDRLNVVKVQGDLGRSAFVADGYLTHFTDPQQQTWHVNVHSQLNLENFLQLVAGKYYTQGQLQSSEAILVDASVTGTGLTRDIEFKAGLGPDAQFVFHGPVGELRKPIGQPLAISGSFTSSPGLIAIKDAQFKTSEALIDLSGTIAYSNNSSPELNLKVDVPKPLPVKEAVALVTVNNKPIGSPDVSGTFAGHVHIKGSLNHPAVRGLINLNDVSIPSAKIAHLTGKIAAPEWIESVSPDRLTAVPATLAFKEITLNNFLLKNVHGSLHACEDAGCNAFDVEKVTADFAKGTVQVTGRISLTGTSKIDVSLNKLDADQVVTQLFNKAGEITGTMNGIAHLQLTAPSEDVLNGLSGQGSLLITNGRVAQFGSLERGISAAKILHQGLFDFNLNNLISTVAPYETGRYQKITADFQLNNKVLAINKVYFQGTELRLRATGTMDLARGYLLMDVGGRIPKVSKRGILGPVADFLSIHGITDVVEDLPERIVSKNASKNQRLSFEFRAEGPLDKPSAISQSAVKSFHWLQTLPGGTAHPALMLGQRESGRPIASDDSHTFH